MEGTLFGGLWRTTNGGVNWVQQLPGGTNAPYRIYMYNSQIGFLRTISTSAIYKTTNSGFNWTYIQTTGAFDDFVMLDSQTGYRAVGFDSDSVFKTTNGGLNWFGQKIPVVPNVYNNYSRIKDLFPLNQDTLWGVYGYVQYINNIYRFKAVIYKTTNGGLNWGYQIPDTNFNINRCRFVSFYNLNTGWCTPEITDRGTLYTETGGDTTIYTGVINNNFVFPDNYILEQNYPNPFNQSSIINYKCSIGGIVKISVYDLTGKKIALIVNELKPPGDYQVRFDGGDLPSGIYFYRMEADNFTKTKKMILMK
jgi:photosystem II stability/assembly factor-like uncharacterized protein